MWNPFQQQSSSDDEEPEHTLDNPYCRDLSHDCHNDWRYHAEFTDNQLEVEPDDQTYGFALRFLGS